MLLSTPHARAVAALRFRALGDETRLRILDALAGGELCVSDLTDRTGLGQSLVSHHLHTLRAAGLVTVSREGRWAYYVLAPTAFDAARDVLDALEPDGRFDPPSSD